MSKRATCHDLDNQGSVDLESWTGRNHTPICSVPTNPDLKHVVKITNFRRKQIEIEIKAEALNGKVIFNSTMDSFWEKTLSIDAKKDDTAGLGYKRESLSAKVTEVGEQETIITKIMYWNKYSRRRVKEDKDVSFNIALI